MPSHTAAAAVTDDVSLTAVPANRPKPLLLKPITSPSVGKMSAASTLNRNTTDMACATSWSSALMTGAVAAIAEPPQIEDPTPISVAVRPGTCIARHSTAAVISEAEMVDRMTGSDMAPTWANCVSGNPKPSSTTAVCRIFFDANFMPGPAAPFSFQNVPMTMPSKMANTAPPTSGTAWPRNQQTTAIRALAAMPGARVLMRDMRCFLRASCMTRSTIAQRPGEATRQRARPLEEHRWRCPRRLGYGRGRSEAAPQGCRCP